MGTNNPVAHACYYLSRDFPALLCSDVKQKKYCKCGQVNCLMLGQISRPVGRLASAMIRISLDISTGGDKTHNIPTEGRDYGSSVQIREAQVILPSLSTMCVCACRRRQPCDGVSLSMLDS